MLDKGASLEFDIEGVTPLEYSKQYENIELENLLLEHKKNM
jgi:ankyrin repeat protein